MVKFKEGELITWRNYADTPRYGIVMISTNDRFIIFRIDKTSIVDLSIFNDNDENFFEKV